jgi:hypothetical protein
MQIAELYNILVILVHTLQYAVNKQKKYKASVYRNFTAMTGIM